MRREVFPEGKSGCEEANQLFGIHDWERGIETVSATGMASEHEGALTFAGWGFWSWLLQRLSGLFLTFFISVHIVALHFLRQGSVDAASVLDRLRDSPPIVVFYLLFTGIVIFHALNGVWGIMLDFAPSTAGRWLLRCVLWAVGLFTFGYGAIVLNALSKLG